MIRYPVLVAVSCGLELIADMYLEPRPQATPRFYLQLWSGLRTRLMHLCIYVYTYMQLALFPS